MGCVFGRRRFIANNLVEGQDDNALEIITKLGFTRADVDLLYTAFWDIDADGSGLIRPAELFAYFEVEGTPFERRLFALFDEDKSGVINFLEFVCTLWNILTLPQGDFGSVAFLLRDPTGRNTISFSDVRVIIEMLHNRKLEKDPSLLSVFLQMRKELDNKISIDEFNRWTAANPSVAPVVMLQLHIRLQIIGERFWVRLSNLRKADPEQGQLDYVKRLQDSVTEKNRKFREKLEAEEAEQRRLSRIGRNAQHYHQRDNIARKESRLLGYFNLKPSKRVTRVIPEQNLSKENGRKERAILEEDEDGEGKHVTDHHNHQHHHVHSSANTVSSNRSRGNSADVTESNELLHTSNKLSSNKNKPIIFKYDNDPPHPGQSGKSKKKDGEGDIDNKISSKHSEKKHKEKKNLKKEYQETVKKVTRKQSSMFDIFASNRKLNYDVLDEDEEDHLAKPKETVPVRRRRSVLKKPNLIKKD